MTDPARMLLVLDACSEVSDAVARTLVGMASRLGLELEGLFVEDEELLRAVELPFVREVSASGQERVIDAERLRGLNREASRALERLIAHAAGERLVGWRYGTREGSRARTAVSAPAHVDLFVPGRPVRVRGRAAHRGGNFDRVALVVQGAGTPQRAAAVLRALAGNGHTREVVLVCDRPPPPGLLAMLAAERLRTYVQQASLTAPEEMIERLRVHEPALLVAPRSMLLSLAPRVIESLPMSLLLLR